MKPTEKGKLSKSSRALTDGISTIMSETLKVSSSIAGPFLRVTKGRPNYFHPRSPQLCTTLRIINFA